MRTYPFAHDGPVYIVCDHDFEIAYYSRLGKKYRRVRKVIADIWEDTTEEEVDNLTFWVVVACAEMRRRHA